MVTKKKASKKKLSRKKVSKKKALSKKKASKKKVVKKLPSKAQQTEDNLVPLDAREQIFVEQFLITAKPEQSALTAGYAQGTAKTKAYMWVRMSQCPNNKLHVATAIEKLQKKRAEDAGVDAMWVLKRLLKEAEADINDLYFPDGGLRPVKEWPLIWRQGLVSGIEVDQKFASDGEGGQEPDGVVAKIKLSDRIKRIELIGKHINVQAFMEKREITGEVTLAERMQRSKGRRQNE